MPWKFNFFQYRSGSISYPQLTLLLLWLSSVFFEIILVMIAISTLTIFLSPVDWTYISVFLVVLSLYWHSNNATRIASLHSQFRIPIKIKPDVEYFHTFLALGSSCRVILCCEIPGFWIWGSLFYGYESYSKCVSQASKKVIACRPKCGRSVSAWAGGWGVKKRPLVELH